MNIVLKTLVLIFSMITGVYCQNFIPNPGFENVNIKLSDHRKYYYSYEDWVDINPFEKYTSMGLPKFSLCMSLISDEISTHTNKNEIIDCYTPYSGESFFFTPAIFFKNLYRAVLIENLKKDSIYYFEMHYKIIDNHTYDLNSINDKIGLFFTNFDFNSEKGRKILKNNSNYDIYKPQILLSKISANEVNTWRKFSKIFKSDRDYKYVIVGNCFSPLIHRT